MKILMSVKGPLGLEQAGFILPHEHVMVDFIGAERTGNHRWNAESVVTTMLPHLTELAGRGTNTLIDATPMFLGRDPRILAELSDRTGLSLVTNTGQYKEPYLPAASFELEPEALAESWAMEWANGIEGSLIRPGFIKTAVEKGGLAPMQRRIIRAAALASRATGLAVATHCGCAVSAAEILKIFEEEGVPSERWIFVHAQNEPALARLIEIGRRGAWIELDGLDAQSFDKHLDYSLRLLDAGLAGRLLLSHDGGWYRVGEPDPRPRRSYTILSDRFLPELAGRGLEQAVIRRLTRDNPFAAYSVEAGS